MGNFIVGGILLILIGMAIGHMRKEKKRGARCIGCPSAGCCGSCGFGCGSGSGLQEKEFGS